jgi:hypothetical protein
LWVDSVQVNARTDPGVVMLRFMTVLPPDTFVEACRIQTPVAHLREMIRAFQETLDRMEGKKGSAMALPDPVASKSAKNGRKRK